MQRTRSEEERESVQQVASRLREYEDMNLAIRLQEEEFNSHYDRNRSERRVMGVDTKKSKEEQELERKYAREKLLAEAMEIARNDEEVARRMQEEFEAEERQLREERDRQDAEMARRLAVERESAGTSPVPPPLAYDEDEQLAREMQERYLRRLSSGRGMLDESTQNELNYYVGRQTVPPLAALGIAQPPTSLRPAAIPTTHFPVRPDAAVHPLPPLPSYAEACTPTSSNPPSSLVSGVSVVSSAVSSSLPPTESNTPRVALPGCISPATSQLLTSTGAAAVPARVPLHPQQSVPDSPLPDPPVIVPQPAANAPPLTRPAPPTNAVFVDSLHPTNPFLQDLLVADYNANNPGNAVAMDETASSSDFGLPPPSDLFHATANTPHHNASARRPEGAVPLMPNLDHGELLQKLPREQS